MSAAGKEPAATGTAATAVAMVNRIVRAAEQSALATAAPAGLTAAASMSAEQAARASTAPAAGVAAAVAAAA